MSTELSVPRVEPVTPLSSTSGHSSSVLGKIPRLSGVRPVIFSFTDQALAVAGSFIANLVLARTQSKEEYGMFALSYSVLTFLSGVHNSLVLEPGTVYGSGRYQNRFPQYLGLILRLNAFVGLILTVLVLLSCLLLRIVAPQFASRSLVGMGVSVGVLLSGAFLRRVFYLQRQPRFAARASFICFITITSGLWVASKTHVLNGCSGFLILGLGWIVAGIGTRRHLEFEGRPESFLDSEPNYWREHWKYSKWVLATAVVFQLAIQGYYWLVAGFLSVKEVGELRAMYLLVSPIDQAFIALSLLLIPVLASYYAANRMANFFSVCKRFALVVAGMTVLVAIVIRTFGKPLIHAIYAGRFDAVAPILYLLALLPILTGMGTVLSGAINSSERPKLVFYAYAASGATTFAAGIPLVIRFGLRGAAYGMLLSSAICTAVLLAGFLVIIRPKLRITDDRSHINYEPPSSSYSPVGHTVRTPAVPKAHLAPIAFFVYSRPEHTRQSLEALRKNELARDTDLFVFSDGANNYAVARAVQTIRNYIRSIEGFRSVTLVERERNFGLSHSIIDGVTTLCNEYGRVIAVEDDIVTSADFLTFMNSALDRYADEANIFSVSGFGLPIQIPQSYAYDAFYSYRFMCWGWGTWKDRWQTADWSVSDYEEFCRDRKRQKLFDRGGNDLSWLLGRHITGRIDSWDTVWAYTHSRNDAVAVLSVKPRAYNIGFDGSGVHCRRVPFRQTVLAAGTSSGYVFPDGVAPDPHLAAAIRRLHHRSPPRQFVRYVYDRLGIS